MLLLPNGGVELPLSLRRRLSGRDYLLAHANLEFGVRLSGQLQHVLDGNRTDVVLGHGVNIDSEIVNNCKNRLIRRPADVLQ